MISFEDVSKVYPSTRTVALSDVTFHMEKGEFVFLVGPSGAGKSTLIKLIYREETPTRGEIRVDGQRLSRLRRKDIPFLRRKLGTVFQDFRLLNDRTVYDNVAFALIVTEASRREIARQVGPALELVGLRDKARAYPRELSGGEQQRVALARAVVTSPKVLIADEPTGNLDPETSWEIMNLLSEINARGTTVLVATHAETIVNAMRRRVIALRDGRIVSDEERGGYVREA